jgi:uncharacterized protein (TIGR03435 family)
MNQATQVLIFALFAATGEGGSACADDTRPAFEVASVKPDQSQTGIDRVQNSNGSLMIVNVSLKRIIGLAYGVDDGQDYLFSGPEWLDSERFDISAKYPLETPRADYLLMFQRLLDERFGLRLHHESRPFTAYALTVAKGGSKLRPTPNAGAYRFSVQKGHASGFSITMPMLAGRLSRPGFELDRRVVDMTGLTGAFDFTLDWSPNGAASDDPADAPAGPSLFTALQEQLGLKLELRKNMPLEVLVVDHAEKVPAAN